MIKKADKIESAQFSEFCNYMVNLFSCPSSSASLERIFSTYGLVWSKLRNRLGAEKAEKLVKVYRSLKAN